MIAHCFRYLAFALMVLWWPGFVFAQKDPQKISSTILQKDSLFWTAYNTCDIEKFKEFLTDDLEFYHDKGGLTLGQENLVAVFKNNLCAGNGFRLRREAVPGTVKVFPLSKSDTIYGAIISGEHVFYILEKDKPARLDGLAKFTHVWLLKNGTWKTSRVLSYDHRPAGNVLKKEITLAPKVIDQWTGKYEGPQSGTVTVQREQNTIVLLIKDKPFVIYPESATFFFSKERGLTFEFVKNKKNKVTKMLVRENGAIAEELKFVK